MTLTKYGIWRHAILSSLGMSFKQAKEWPVSQYGVKQDYHLQCKSPFRRMETSFGKIPQYQCTTSVIQKAACMAWRASHIFTVAVVHVQHFCMSVFGMKRASAIWPAFDEQWQMTASHRDNNLLLDTGSVTCYIAEKPLEPMMSIYSVYLCTATCGNACHMQAFKCNVPA